MNSTYIANSQTYKIKKAYSPFAGYSIYQDRQVISPVKWERSQLRDQNSTPGRIVEKQPYQADDQKEHLKELAMGSK